MLKAGMIRALGAMSGTSLDGVDAAVIETDGLTVAGLERRPIAPIRQRNGRCCARVWAVGKGRRSRRRGG